MVQHGEYNYMRLSYEAHVIDRRLRPGVGTWRVTLSTRHTQGHYVQT